jgi:hypothetical protein
MQEARQSMKCTNSLHKRNQRKSLTLQSTEQQSGSCYSTQTIATEEEVYLNATLSRILLLSIILSLLSNLQHKHLMNF